MPLGVAAKTGARVEKFVNMVCNDEPAETERYLRRGANHDGNGLDGDPGQD